MPRLVSLDRGRGSLLASARRPLRLSRPATAAWLPACLRAATAALTSSCTPPLGALLSGALLSGASSGASLAVPSSLVMASSRLPPRAGLPRRDGLLRRDGACAPGRQATQPTAAATRPWRLREAIPARRALARGPDVRDSHLDAIPNALVRTISGPCTTRTSTTSPMRPRRPHPPPPPPPPSPCCRLRRLRRLVPTAMMLITQSTTHTPSRAFPTCPRPQAYVSRVRRCDFGSVSSGKPAVQGPHAICKGWGGCCRCITIAGCSAIDRKSVKV
jgi:hypothetical protein